MSKTNHICVHTTGTDPNKFINVPALEKKTGKKLFKEVIKDFRMAGKVAVFVKQNAIKVAVVHSNPNNYGYQDHDYYYLLKPKDAKTVEDMLNTRSQQPKKKPVDSDKAWCRQLVKFTKISMDMAMEIAEEKKMYKLEQIKELEERQIENFSIKREKLINKLRRSNPLRRIKDEDHARAILAASVRHNYSDYDIQLEKARNEAMWGVIPFSDVKDYARAHTTYEGKVEDYFNVENEPSDE